MLHRLGVGFVSLRMSRVAGQCFARAVHLDASRTTSWEHLAWGHFYRERPAEAIALYERMLARHPRATSGWHQLGLVYQSCDRHDDAVHAFSEAVALANWDAEAHLRLAESFEALGRRREALDSYGRAVRHDPFLLDACWGQARLLEEFCDWDRAVVAAEHLITLKDSGAGPFLAAVYFRVERLADAERVSRVVLADTPEDVYARSLLTAALWEQGRTEEAAQVLRSGLDASPTSPMLLCTHAMLHLHEGRLADAHAEHLSARERHPDDVSVIIVGGELALARGDADEALAAFDKALATWPDPDTSSVETARAAALLVLGRLQEAEDAVMRVLERDPTFFATSSERQFGYPRFKQVRELAQALQHTPGA